MARKLNKKQKQLIEKIARDGVNSFSLLDGPIEQKIAHLNFYETVYQDMERYLWDCRSNFVRSSRSSIYGGLQF